MRAIPILLAALLLTRAGPALAEVAPAGWGLPQLMQGFAQQKTSRAHFTERKYMRMLKQPLEDSGILLFEAPDHLMKQTQQPKPERLLIEGDTLTIDRLSKEQILNRGDYPQIWTFIEGIRATLAGDLPALEAVYTVALSGEPANWQMSLQPRDPQMRQIVDTIRISGSDAHITRIETLEHDGDHTDMTVVEDAR
jgi:hypothetical protein